MDSLTETLDKMSGQAEFSAIDEFINLYYLENLNLSVLKHIIKTVGYVYVIVRLSLMMILTNTRSVRLISEV